MSALALRLVYLWLASSRGAEVINLGGHSPYGKSFERYHQSHDRSSMDYDTCRVDFHNIYDVEYTEEYDLCHITELENEEIESMMTKYGLKACCVGGGVMETATGCRGRNKDGQEAEFQSLDICLEHDPDKKSEIESLANCSAECQLISGTLDEAKFVNLTDKYIIEGKEFDIICIGSKCDDDGDYQLEFKACGNCPPKPRPTNTPVSNQTETNQPKPKDDQELERDVPLCCIPPSPSETGVLDGQTFQCSKGSQNSTVADVMSACNWRNKGSIRLVNQTEVIDQENVVCTSWAQDKGQSFTGFLVCQHDCDWNEKCIQLCYQHGEAFDMEKRAIEQLPPNTDLKEVFGLSSDTRIIDAKTRHWEMVANLTELHPEAK